MLAFNGSGTFQIQITINPTSSLHFGMKDTKDKQGAIGMKIKHLHDNLLYEK
jgi:hypothetical protein